ncbi:MAG: PAS domain-containing sensor histidine kinase [Oculatellaceae cyanobacterium Prado106]|jgi:PAS domain S-box-containing protein|nr:PAS domain-containing sensor histidine kinase [Oculatellaceae cyanobacterium Prado106]
MIRYFRSGALLVIGAIASLIILLTGMLLEAIVPAFWILTVAIVTLSLFYGIERNTAQVRRMLNLNMLGMGIWTDAGVIVQANDAFLNLLGYTRQELNAGQITWRKITPAEYHERNQIAIQEIQTKGYCTPFEKEYFHKDGRRISAFTGGASLSAKATRGIFFVIDLTPQKQAEAQLQQSKALLEGFMRHTPTNVFIKDDVGRYIFVNHRVEQEFDRPLAEWVGKTDFELFPAELAELYHESDTRVLETGKALELLEHLPTIKGERLVHSLKFPLQNAQEKPYLAGSAVDITERITIETLLRQRESEMQLIADTVPALISYINANQCYRFVNQRYEQWLGKPIHEIYGKTLQEVLGITTYAVIQPYVEQVLSGQPVDYETQISRQGGKTCYVHASYAPQWNEAGNVVGFVALIQDISDRKQAEQVLENALQKLNSHVENTPLAVVEWGHDYRVIRWSSQAEAIFGWQAHEVLGKRPWEWNFVYSDDATEVRAAIERLVNGTEQRSLVRNCNYTKDQSIVFCEWYSSALRDQSGQLESVLCLVLDVTERKRIEDERAAWLERERAARSEAERTNQAKDEFLVILSHELRTPLNAISGWVQLMKLNSTNPQMINPQMMNQAWETIERNTNLQMQLVEDLLSTAQILQGNMKLEVCPVNLAEPVEMAIEQVRALAKQKNVQVQITLLSSLHSALTQQNSTSAHDSYELDGQPIELEAHLQNTPIQTSQLFVLGDAQRLQQVIWNLLSNAVKFNPTEGQVEIKLEKITLEQNPQSIRVQNTLHPVRAESSEYAQITVTDTGIGIAPEVLPHIFDRFYQADSSLTRSAGGLGLGLAIVHHLVELHGGTITAHSAGLGQGATFTLTLPLLRSEFHQVQPESSARNL